MEKETKEGIVMIVAGLILFSSMFFMCMGDDDNNDATEEKPLEIIGTEKNDGTLKIHVLVQDTNKEDLLQVTQGQFSFISGQDNQYDVNDITTIDNRLRTSENEWEGYIRIDYTSEGVEILKFQEKFEDDEGRIYEGDILTADL